jgi:hypothetical protein
VINDYSDIGRETVLRGALDGGFSRDRAGAIVAELRERERALQDIATIKVEFIVRLP